MEIRIEDISVGVRFRKDLGDLEALAASMADIGLLQPIGVTPANELIFGKRRIEAARQLGWETIEAVVLDLDDALDGEHDENLIRKGFTISERVAIGQVLEDRLGNRQGERTDLKPSQDFAEVAEPEEKRTRTVAARKAGMGNPETYRQAKAVVESGDEALIAGVDSGELSVSKAFKTLKLQRRKEEKQLQRQSNAAHAVARAVEGVVCGDFREVADQIADESCPLIFTDPPYDRASIALYEDLGKLASRILLDGGSLITFAGMVHLPEVINAVLASTELRWFWSSCCKHTGQSRLMKEHGIRVGWKPLLWFVKGDFRRDRSTIVTDFITSAQEKTHHDWQQSTIEARYCIQHLSDPGELVVDPFCGGGTTALAAKESGRKFWTCEIDQETYNLAVERIGAGIADQTPALPDGKFGLIYADPPWRYEFSSADSRKIENQYPTMSLAEITELPVANLTLPDCLLFLWTTSPKLKEGLSVLESWGFEYKTQRIWDKERLGMGYYFRQQHEILLVGKKGNPQLPPPEHRPRSVYREKSSGHSIKPISVIEDLEKMFPAVPKIELFSRSPRPGWVAWGNEIETAKADFEYVDADPFRILETKTSQDGSVVFELVEYLADFDEEESVAPIREGDQKWYRHTKPNPKTPLVVNLWSMVDTTAVEEAL